MYKLDSVRTRINQDLRGAMDILGANVRIAGENFPGSFPAIEIIDGSDGDPDTLVLRRNLLDEVLKVCVPITASSGGSIVFAQGTAQGCIYADNTQNFNAWSAYRDGETVSAYIFNTVTNLGEWIDYSGESDSGTSYAITTAGSSFTNEYDADGSAVYVMEEWKFSLNGNMLQLEIDGDTAAPLNVAPGIVDFQVQAVLPDGTVQDSYSSSDDWTLLHTVRISLTGRGTWRRNELERTLVSEFFPRNVLSN